VNEYICHSLLTKQAYYELEARIPTKTGIDKYFIAKAEILYDQAGNPVRMEGISQDITHIKKAEEDLKFKDYLLQNVNDAIVSADKHLDITSWNKAAETIYGYTEQEALGKNLPQLLCFNPPDSDSEAHQEFLDKGYFKGNLTMKRKDGSDVIIEAHTIPLKDEKGNLIGRVSVDRDITAYSYMQHKAEESEHMLKLVLHTVPQAIFWKDVHSVFRGCNESFIKMVGLADASEVIGKTDEEMFWGVSRGRDIQHQDEQIINGNIPGLFYTKLFQRKDGRSIWMDIIRIPMYNTEKQIIGVLGSLEDITEKRQTEQALTNSRSNLQAIIENTDDLIWSVDLEMRIISMNSKLSHYSDLHFDKPLKAGDNFAEALPEQFKKRLQKVVRKVIKGEKMYFSKRYTLNNNYYWYDISVYPIVEADGQIRGISFMVRDATERKKQEKLILKFVKQHSQLKLQQEKLKMLAVVQGQEEERRLISMELHDGVGQMLTALNFKMNKLSDKILPIATADISLSLDEIGRLQKSIYQEVRRISENLMPQFLNDFPLEKALEQLIIQTFGGTGIVVNSVCKRDHHTFDKGLEIAIFRITQEIFNNIHKHSQATKVYVTLQLKKTLIYLLVKDNGIGFDKSAGNQKMGKGLNNISQRVSLLNGSSFVASHPGKGCQLQIKIPVNSYEKS
jgi:PAS domain S-box-containing protein